ncbi:hypothetical protein V8C44DRAFT_315099, partial [Trichoderma aethiopicum]
MWPICPCRLNLLASCHPHPSRTSKTASAKFCRWPCDEHPCVHKDCSELRSPLAVARMRNRTAPPLLLLSPTAHTSRQTVSRRARCAGNKTSESGRPRGRVRSGRDASQETERQRLMRMPCDTVSAIQRIRASGASHGCCHVRPQALSALVGDLSRWLLPAALRKMASKTWGNRGPGCLGMPSNPADTPSTHTSISPAQMVLQCANIPSDCRNSNSRFEFPRWRV